MTQSTAIAPSSTTCRDIAIRARRAGISPVAIKPGTKKHCLTWARLQHEPADEQEIEAWYQEDSSRGVGIICGQVSGGLEVLDFDAPEMFDAFLNRAIETGDPDLVVRVAVGYHEATPSGGVHIAYRCTAIEPSQKLARRPGPSQQSPHQSDVLVETRGEGSLAVVAPSRGSAHSPGGAYRLLHGGVNSIVTVTPEERMVLLRLARSLDEEPPAKLVVGGSSASRGATVGSGNRPGDDFTRRASWSLVLEPHGWTPTADRGGIWDWRRPGKTEGMSATTNHGDLDLLFVFSSSTPFETGIWYTKFHAYTVLNHEGDFSAAARDLAQQGYGGAEPEASPVVGHEWPLPLGSAAYHGLLGDTVRAIEPHTEADPAALLIQLLLAVGNAVGRGPHFVAEADRHCLNQYVVLVGETSKGRKGTSWGYIPRLLGSVESGTPGHAAVGLNVSSGLSSGEGLIWQVRDPISTEDDHGVHDKRLVILESEFASTLRVLSRSGNTLSAVIRNAWDTGDLATLTKNSPAKATGAHLSIVGHVTRAELLRELTRTEAGNGFANRFLWVCVRRSKVLPEGGQMQDAVLESLAHRLTEVLRVGTAMGELRRDDEARALWYEVYGELSEEKPGLFGAVIARAEPQVMRLACIYAVLDGSDRITKPHLEAALEVWRYAEDSARFIFGDKLGDPVADDILAALRDRPDGMTWTDIRDLFGRNQKSGSYGRALQDLLGRGLVFKKDEDTGGRKAERWFATRLTTKTTKGQS